MARVLVVEDDSWIGSVISDDLADRGYEVSTARNGVEALRRLQDSVPNAIVLDLMMPEMHGWDFLDSYPVHTGGRVIPIVVVSAAGAVPRSAAAKGVRQFLSKPFDIEELARAVAEAVNATEPGVAAIPTFASLQAIALLPAAAGDDSRLSHAPAPI